MTAAIRRVLFALTNSYEAVAAAAAHLVAAWSGAAFSRASRLRFDNVPYDFRAETRRLAAA
jgi:hypothetical protein